MRVKRLSLVFHFALKYAGITPQIIPPRTEATNMMRMSRRFGSLSPI